MKKLHYALVCLVIAFGSEGAVAQVRAPIPSVMLDVQNKAAGTSHTTGIADTKMLAGPVQGVRNHSTTLEITVRNMDKMANEVSVEWYYFARKIQEGHVSKDFVADSGNKIVSLKPGGIETIEAVSKPTQTYNTTTSATVNIPNGDGTSSRTGVSIEHPGGTKTSGWFVRISVNGILIDAKGSEPRYEEAARDSKKYADLVGNN